MKGHWLALHGFVTTTAPIYVIISGIKQKYVVWRLGLTTMFFLSFTLFLLSAVFVAGRDILTARQSSNAAGNQQCSRFMCVTATANDTTIQYALSTTGSRTPGWMAMGFGRSMLNSPMVIMWANDDGTITLSQREASAYSTPQVVSSPDRVATLSETLSSTSDSSMTFTFTVDAGTSTASTENIIYAFGITNPGSSDEGAALQQHLDYGSWEINLSVPIDASATTVAPPQSTSTSTTGSESGSGGNPTDDIPLQPYQRLIVAHAVFCVVGFLFFLPFGSLLARYLRTFSPKWFTGHWISQFALAGTTIIIGFALGVQSVTEAKALHLDSTHKKWGVVLFALYLAQCGVGAVIHWVKPKRSTRRPLQNYFHAVLGLLIIALAFYQVRTGYKTEWPTTTGRGDVNNAIDIVWYIWVVLIPVLYFVGLSFIPKQYRQEAENRKGGWAGNGRYSESVDHINMSHVRQERYPG